MNAISIVLLGELLEESRMPIEMFGEMVEYAVGRRASQRASQKTLHRILYEGFRKRLP